MKTLFLQVILFICCLLLSTSSFAQPNLTYYWKGGTGNFNDANMWWVNSFNSGTTATQSPNSTNTVYFTDAAFSAPGATVTIDISSNCDSMVWENTILPANAPVLAGASTVSLDIYGSFFLTDNMTFSYQGSLRFRSQRTGIETIDCKGKMMRIMRMEWDGTANTEFQLASPVHVEDLNNAKNNLLESQGGFAELLSGTLNFNGQDASFDFFHSFNGNPNRGLILTNSEITLDGYHNRYCWRVDFNATAPNYTTFDATGSHLIFNHYYGYNWFALGEAMTYDRITTQVDPARTSGMYDVYYYIHLGLNEDCVINHFHANARSYLIYTTNSIYINNLYYDDPWGELSYHTSGAPNLYLENIFTPSSCDQFYNMRRISTGGNRMTIHKMTPGTLNFNNILFTGINADISTGNSFVANSSIDGGDNTNITINAPAAAVGPYYFRNMVDNKWHTLGNWFVKTGPATFVPATCLPNANDDVFFDNLSYTSSGSIADVDIDSSAYCHDITFENSIPASSRLDFREILKVFGDIKGCPTIRINRSASPGQIFVYGVGDTIQLNGAEMNLDLFVEKIADYSIVGDYRAPNRIINAGHGNSTLRMESDTLELFRFYPGTLVMDSTQVYLYASDRWSAYDRGGAKTYTGNATFHFQPTNFTAISMRTLPNVIFYAPTYCMYYDMTIQGDLTLLDDGIFGYMYYGNYTTRSRVNVTGSMALYNGDMNLAAGHEYTFSSAVNSFIQVAGDLNAMGDCANPIVLKTSGYATGIIPITVSGAANIQDALVQGLDNTGNPTITAANSIDNGDNSNITFSAGVGQTFYWRADLNDATDFEGDWNDPNHWTTDPTDLVGLGACIPSIRDSVIFDALSFSPSSNGCTVPTGTNYCRSLIFRADARLIGTGTTSGNVVESPTQLHINESLELFTNMTNFDYRGSIHMIGSGDVITNGTVMEIYKIKFDNPTGVWNLQSDIAMDNSWSTSITYARYGILDLSAGTLNTNNYNITIPAQFTSTGTENRTLNLGSSVITHQMNGTYYFHWPNQTEYPWDVRTSTNLVVNAGTSQIIFQDDTRNYVYDKQVYMGDGITYNNVRFEDDDDPIDIYRSSNYAYLDFEGTAYLYDNNSFDSLGLEAGAYYYFGAGNTQTLNAPHGRVNVKNGNSSTFVSMESTVASSTAYLHKDYGYAFCVDFIKVRDVEGTKESNLALVPTGPPTNFQTLHPFLEFQTGLNSDNINNSATGIWAFNLPPLVSPQIVSDDTVNICGITSNMYAPISLTGTSPYFLDYTWTDVGGGSGANTITVNDDDNDPATPFVYDLILPSTAVEIQYNIDVRTSRCGDLTSGTPDDLWVFQSTPNTLIDVVSSASCVLNNESIWRNFLDVTSEKPILAIRDSANATDLSALGQTDIDVYFDGTVQTVSYSGETYPYLQRHWEIVPTTNGPARVRLFFTQQELDALAGAGTFAGTYNGGLNPANEIQVLRYASGTIGVGAADQLAHTVVPVSGTVASPFSATTDVIAIEFDVPSFSHFIIIPTENALLPLELEAFDATALGNKVKLDWKVSNEQNVKHYEIERYRNPFEVEQVLTQTALGKGGEANYEAFDTDPYRGTSYYRVKSVDFDGTVAYSDWKAVEIEGWDVLQVYPIPTKDELVVELTATLNEEVSITVYDALGSQVLIQNAVITAANQQLLTVNVGGLAEGMYFITIRNSAGYTQQRKFIVQD